MDFTLHEYLGGWGRGLADGFRILYYEDLPHRTSFDRGTYVLAALDQLNPGMLRFIDELHNKLQAEGGFRFLNHPTRTLRRFELLTELRRLDRNEFDAVRANADLGGLRYPVFLRSERGHEGALSSLLRAPAELDRAIGRALVLGRRMHDLLAVEFCDTADEKGFYRKYSAFIVGDRVIARSLAYGRGWMLKHAGSEFSESMLQEERDYVLANPHSRKLAEIFAIAGVEYGRIDYALKNDRIQTWEINLHATIGRGRHAPGDTRGRVPTELRPLREETKKCFYSSFESAWRSVDLSATDRPAVPIVLDPGIAVGGRSRQNNLERFSGARRLLRPAKPLLEPIATVLLTILGRFARLSARVHRSVVHDSARHRQETLRLSRRI
jgi:hypothetical protein